ncbi:hypothetical protein BDD14_0197 [Edaphobacter modestus]|uniref:Uncharacterized protein n=1 Tax=Edaphobacter modestus TaxID=388466 RepID=A0A4Q7YPV8_9BACT|nr:hypothetical protein BDD14_0197 [Edaphobacter modestus]
MEDPAISGTLEANRERRRVNFLGQQRQEAEPNSIAAKLSLANPLQIQMTSDFGAKDVLHGATTEKQANHVRFEPFPLLQETGMRWLRSICVVEFVGSLLMTARYGSKGSLHQNQGNVRCALDGGSKPNRRA